jgi:hypothetical protein
MSVFRVLRRRGLEFTGAILAGAVLGAAGGCSESTSTSPTPAGADYEVHEWGVLVGCQADTSYFLTSRPEVPSLVRVPVIYFHSTEKKPFTAQVRFASGGPTDTYPEAAVAGSLATWSSVTFSTELGREPSADYAPLEGILPVLNDVEADMLEYGGTESRFLFYEGETLVRNEIVATYDFSAREATLENQADYAVYDVILVGGDFKGKRPADDSLYVGTVGELCPHQTATIEFFPQAEIPLEEGLVSLGFTEGEAGAFAELWAPPVLSPGLTEEWANLIYRMPQGEYDRLIRLEISPLPRKVIRALYVLVHLEE